MCSVGSIQSARPTVCRPALLRQCANRPFPGEATVSDPSSGATKLVRQFRQILIWPLQLQPIRSSAQIQEPWDVLMQAGPHNPWTEPRDQFSRDPAQFQQRHYSEFVTFLPYVRRFLYGEGKGRTGAGIVDSPIRVFRRNDVAALLPTPPGVASPPLTLKVPHGYLVFFYG